MEKKYTCNICMSTYTHRNSFIRHFRLLHGKENDNNFVCSTCNIVFSRKDALAKHIQSRRRRCQGVNSTDTFICDVCQNMYPNRVSFLRHYRYVHERVVKPIVSICNVCKEIFTNRRSFLCHRRSVHEGAEEPRIFICNVCQKIYNNRRSFLHHYRSLHEKVVKLDIFICNVCNKTYPNRGSFLRHYRSVHAKVVKYKVFICNTCNKTYNDRRVFLRHCRSVHEEVVNPSVFICNVCNKTYFNRGSFLRHYRSIHERPVKREVFNCTACDKRYCRKDVLMFHMRKRHRICSSGLNSTYVCAFCYKSFMRKWDIRRHIFGCHLQKNRVPCPAEGSMKCVFCKDSFSTVNNIMDHIMQRHDVHIVHQHIKFTSRDEFDEWKKNMQNTTITSYQIRHSAQYKQTSIISFVCHRSGLYEVKTSNRKKRVKYQGVKKLGAFCPAAITLRINKVDGSCNVSYISTHLGHNVFDKKELAHINIPKEERVYVDRKIACGVPNKRILIDNISTCLAEKDPEYYMSEHNLPNISDDQTIRQTSNIAPEKDPTNVDAFIVSHEKSILYYKRQNEIDEKYKALQLDDIVIVMMTQFQTEMLIKYGHKVIAVDNTVDFNRYHFMLHTFIVIDNFHEGIPVACIISNRNDEVVIKIALECIKDKVGILRPITFMSDTQLTYINSWEKIMGSVKHRLFCNWHVFEEWRENFIKIKNTYKKKCMRRRVYELAMCPDETTFKAQLQELLEDADPDLEAFLTYFKIRYSKDTKSWANCYCKHAFINTNTHCEAFNHHLKHFHGRLPEKASLTDCLELLNLYLNTEECAWERKEIKGRVPSKLKILRSRHDNFEKELEAEKVHVQVRYNNTEEGGGWDVCISEVENEVANVYHVSKCDIYCDMKNCRLYCEKCDACQYAYQCTCPDNMMKHYMCKHIHALCTTLKCQESTLTIEKIEDVHAENIEFSLEYVQINGQNDDDLQAQVDDILYAQDDEVLYAYDDDESKDQIGDVLYAHGDDESNDQIDEVLYVHDDESKVQVDDVLPAHDDEEFKAHGDEVFPVHNHDEVLIHVDDLPHARNIEDSPKNDVSVCNIIKQNVYDLFMKNLNNVKTSAEAIVLYDSLKPALSPVKGQSTKKP